MTNIHDNRSVECSNPSCPCHEWSARMPSGPFSGYQGQGEGTKTRPEAVSGLKISPPASAFDHEWASAPTVATRYTEQAIAEYWFLRGMRAEREQATELLNQDLHELVRLAGERLR